MDNQIINKRVFSTIAELNLKEFAWIKDYLYKQAGIVLNESKRAMVMGRLEKRLRHYGLNGYGDYFNLFQTPGFEKEATIAIDLLTTNETYFFREPKHFEFLSNHILPKFASSQTVRIWSAASSSGEEAYTIGMLLAESSRSLNWEIIGSDISSRILERAKSGLYPDTAAEKIPPKLLKKYCLKGSGDYEGFLLIDSVIRKNIKFIYANLIYALPDVGMFDIIFLRNVMIYFDIETKQRLLERIVKYLKPGGYFFISHSESLNGMRTELECVSPSIYIKPN